MQYAFLIYETEAEFAKRAQPSEEEFWGPWRSYQRSLVEAGIFLGGSPLEPADDTATSVRVRGGELRVQDGPFADTKEQLGGFMIVDLPNLDAALKWAARCPAASYGCVEVRPVADLTGIFGPGTQFFSEA